MANKNVRDGEYLRDRKGLVYADLGSERNKCYAVIVMCGHCGDGYYVPIMFTTRSNNISNAIEDIKMTPRVKRERTDCILDAFEITELEKFIIDSMNDRDKYLKGYIHKEGPEMEERRVAISWGRKRDGTVKTADEYPYYDVLARAFAPRVVGSEMVTPNRVNKNELLNELFKCAAIRYGIEMDNPFFLLLYYMHNGKNNDMGIVLDGNKLTCDFEGVKKAMYVSDKIMKFYDRYGVREDEEEKKHDFTVGEAQKPSRIDKFQKRMERYKDKKKDKKEETPGESEPGE